MCSLLDDILSRRIAIIDGGMGTMLQRHRLDEGDFRNERLASHPHRLMGNLDLLGITRPDLVFAIHHAYIAAGADIVSTNTFRSDVISQAHYGLESWVYEMNVANTRLARAAADGATARTPERPRFVAGVIGPTDRMLSTVTAGHDVTAREAAFDDMRAAYLEQVRGLIDGGADLLLVETATDTANIMAAVAAIHHVQHEKSVALPLMLSVTATSTGRTLAGETLESFHRVIDETGPWAVGFNCGLGAAAMTPHVAALSPTASCWIAAYPNAGLPDALGAYGDSPADMAQRLGEIAAGGHVNIIGGCCGTTPQHIVAIAAAVADLSPRERRPNRHHTV